MMDDLQERLMNLETQNRLLRQALGRASDCSAVVDAEGRCHDVFAEPDSRLLDGRDPATIETIFDLLGADDGQLALATSQRALGAGTVAVSAHEIVRAGVRHVFEGQASPLDGGLAIWVGRNIITQRQLPSHEINEHKALEASLVESERRFRRLADTAMVGIFEARLGGEILYVNQAMADMFEYPGVGALLQDDAYAFFPDRAVRDRLIERLRDGETLWGLELALETQQGNPLVVVINATLEGDKVVGTVINITRRKQMELEQRHIRQQLQLITDALPVLISYIDQDRRYQFVNRRYEDWFGLQREEIIGKTVTEALGEAVAKTVATDIEAALSGVSVAFERAIPYPTGTRFTRTRALPHRLEDGTIAGMIVMVDDITERRQNEEQLRQLTFDLGERVKELRGLQDIVLYGEEALDLHTYLGKVAVRVPASMQYPDDCVAAIEFEGDTYGDPAALDTLSRLTAPIHVEEVAVGNLYVGYRQPHTFLDDEHLHIVAIASRVGQYIARRRLLERLTTALHDLEASNQELQQFAYVASHDLQEPLRMVSSYLQLIQRRYQGHLDERADQYIYFAVDGAERMKTLIEDLLTYSRVTTQAKPAVPTDLERVLRLTRRNLEVSLEETGATITHDPLPTVQADLRQMGQLFQNLISNAIKFRGAAPPTIHISAEQVDAEWVISVRDNGIGIDPQYHDQIFEVFKRLHSRAEYPGTGIGLAICKRIVERHGGRMWLDSAAGQGSTFSFTLPVE